MDRDDRPLTRYAQSGDLHVAFQTLGDGPLDIVFVAPGVMSIETVWELPAMARYLRDLAQIGRVVLFDSVGSGLSDPLPELAHSLDSWTTDVRIVMDAAGLDEAVLHCFDSAGTMAMVFAAMYPDRVTSLVLANTFARVRRSDDFPIGIDDADWFRYRSFAIENWGTGRVYRAWAGGGVGAYDLEELARQERRVFSPGSLARTLDREWETDIRDVLSMIQAPTLVLHHVDNRMMPPEHGRFIAERIPGARFVAVDGSAHTPYEGDTRQLLEEIRHFLTGHREALRVDRVLATILFTDIVDSTRMAAERGDELWRTLLDQHDDAVNIAVRRFDGRVVKSTGDGALATFASPGRAIAAARSIAQAVQPLDIEVRAGLHTGECELRGDDVGGLAVHVAARIAALAAPGQLLVSRTVTDLVVGSELAFTEAGHHRLKGVPGEWPLFSAS